MPSTIQRLFRTDSKRRASQAAAQSQIASATWFETRRPHIDPVGLARDFLKDPARSAEVADWLKPLLDDPAVIQAIQQDDAPIPANQDREGYFGERHLAYWLSGVADLRMVERMVPASAFANVLDFGGATGRFARQVPLFHAGSRVTIAELSYDHVMWCDRYFGKQIRAVKVSPAGPFPLADRSMTLCVAFSVFTHIDVSESAWLAEVERVLAPGGYAVLTIHCEKTWPLLEQQTSLLAALKKDPRFVEAYCLPAPMPEERMVFDYMPGTKFHCGNTFVHTDYVRRVWGKWFDIVDIHSQAHHGFQTAVVLRKMS